MRYPVIERIKLDNFKFILPLIKNISYKGADDDIIIDELMTLEDKG
jgi:hypothetical protein